MSNFEPTSDQNLDDSVNSGDSELSFSDKMIGIFSEPGKTYESISNHPLRTIDWLLPFFILLFIVTATQLLLMSNKELHSVIVEKQMTKIQNNFDKMVKEGKMSQEDADKQLSLIQDRMDNFGALQMVLMVVGIFIGGFIIFFIVAGIYFLFVKFILKGDGNYTSVLIASSMTSYIVIIQVILAAIFAFMLGRPFQDTSVASFLNSDRTTYLGFFLSKLDIISIWAYAVLAIGLAKLFKSKNTTAYYLVIFGIWVVGGFILFFIGKSVPIFNSFVG